MNIIRNISLSRWFFVVYAGIVILYAASFAIPILKNIALIILISLLCLTVLDILLLFSSKAPISITRNLQSRMNLGDQNLIEISLKNNSWQALRIKLFEGMPTEMQYRKALFTGLVFPNKEKTIAYHFVPKTRGEFEFTSPMIVIQSSFVLLSRKFTLELENKVHVYPSVEQMKKYELMVFHQQKTSQGIKKIRRIGNNSEFEQIKNYVQGDEVKSINWKATSRRFELMVNQYQEEKSQNVYCIIDKSRNMQLEFEQMNLLDHSINACLNFANIAIKNGDKFGLLSYSDKMGTELQAKSSKTHLTKVYEALYNQQTEFQEPNFELLYQSIQRGITSRSLLVLFTNFQTEFALKRALPMLKRINQRHLLVLVFFENSILQADAFQSIQKTNDIYTVAVAEKMVNIKSKMMMELRKNNIQTILTTPEHLSIQTINKYLELKAKGAI